MKSTISFVITQIADRLWEQGARGKGEQHYHKHLSSVSLILVAASTAVIQKIAFQGAWETWDLAGIYKALATQSNKIWS